MSPSKEAHTFISYSRANMDFTLRLARELKSSGFPIWVDQLDIPIGARWDDEVERALDACGIFMVILTPASIASENVKDEIAYAIDSGKRILPVLLEKCNVPLRLRRFQHVDFTTMSYDQGVEIAKQLLTNFIKESKPPRSILLAIQNAQVEAEHKTEEPEKVSEKGVEDSSKATIDQSSIATEESRKESLDRIKAELERKAKDEEERQAIQRVEKQSLASQRQEVGQMSLPSMSKAVNESIWRLGRKQVLQAIVGIVTSSILSIPLGAISNSVIVVFFGLTYGPWVGLAVGIVGSLIASLFSSNFVNIFYYGLMGMIAGMATGKIRNFRDFSDILKAIGIGWLGAIASFILFSPLLSLLGFTYFEDESITLLASLASNTVILPILMLVFANLVGRTEGSVLKKPLLPSNNRMLWIAVSVVTAGVIACICVALAWVYYQQ